MISAASVKDRLKNHAREDGRTMQDELIAYSLERTSYYFSILGYTKCFMLKNDIFLYWPLKMENSLRLVASQICGRAGSRDSY